MEITHYLSELLYDHDCVIIPGFGGFVCNYHPAQIHPGHHTFHPPYKKILFNNELKANDGLLASHIAINKKVSFNDALQLIDDFSANLTEKLETGKKLTLESIGIFYLDEEGNIQFEQDNKINYLKDSFGLGTFVSPPIERRAFKPERKPEPVLADRKQPAKPNRILQAAAYWSSGIAATILLVGLILLNFSSFDDFANNQTGWIPRIWQNNEIDFRPVQNQEPVQVSAENIIPQKSKETFVDSEKEASVTESESTLEISENLPEKVATQPTPEPESTPAPSVDEVKPLIQTEKMNQRMYHLIAGSFERAENAKDLMQMYTSEGYDPKIIGQAENGNYRVSIAAYIRKDEALTELEKARAKYNPAIWMLRQ